MPTALQDDDGGPIHVNDFLHDGLEEAVEGRVIGPSIKGDIQAVKFAALFPDVCESPCAWEECLVEKVEADCHDPANPQSLVDQA